MSAGLFSRIKNWVNGEILTNEDLNAEFDNIISNFEPDQMGGHSDNVTEMQRTADPGEVGTESLATNISGEIERLRQLVKEVTGEDQWYETPVSSLLGLSNAIGTGLTDNRIVSGRTASGSAQPQFLTPNGAASTATVEGATTNLIYYVNGTEYSITTDLDLTGLTAAPSSNNTCLINDTNASDQVWTKYQGENGTEIPVDTMGTEIQSLVGSWAAFSLAGTSTEYLIAFVESTTRLTRARRGYFFDSTDAAVGRAAYANNDVLTLLKLTWVFAKSDGTLTATYNNPVWADDEPSSPALGDYWYDISTNKWKVRGVSAFEDANATLIGICVQDTTNTIGARSFEFFKNYDSQNSAELVYDGAALVECRHPGSIVNVWGSTIKNEQNIHIWDMAVDLDSGVTEAASTTYYFYLTETGDTIISDVRPHDRREDLGGYYHTHKSWRCLGSIFNDASQNFDISSINSYFRRYETTILEPTTTAASLVNTEPKLIRLDGSGGAFAERLPPAALNTGMEIIFLRTDDTPANAITITPYGSETINGDTSYLMYLQYEKLHIVSDGTNWLILDTMNATLIVRASNTASTTMAATSETLVPFATEAIDTHNTWDGTATFTAPWAGYYRFGYRATHVSFGSTYAGNELRVKQNTTVISAAQWGKGSATAVTLGASLTDRVLLASSDTLKFYYFNGGTAHNLTAVAHANSIWIEGER